MDGSSQSPRRAKLSVAILARDEQGVLSGTIESVRSIADEIVVLDTGSIDATPEVATHLGARLIRSNWSDDFSAARNLLLRQVRGDWVLWLDAGEWLDPDSAARLRCCVDELLAPDRVYMVLIEAPSPLPGASAEQILQCRLMPRRTDLRFEGRLRETVFASMERLGMMVDTAPGRIRRHVRHHDPAHRQRRARRDLRILTAEAAQGHLSPRALVAQGEAFADLGQIAVAREAFLAALEASEHGSRDMLEAFYGLLTTYEGDPAGRSQQMTVCLEALEIFPFDAQLHLAMGNYLQARNQLDLAARSFRMAVEYGQVNAEVWHLAEVAEVAASCLSLTLQLQGKSDEAADVLRRAMALSPDSGRLLHHRFDLAIKRGEADEALELAKRIGIPPERLAVLGDAIRGACRCAAGEHEAALPLLEQARAAGCTEPLCLRWLSIALLRLGRTDEAAPILRQWLAAEPHSAEAKAYLEAIQPAAPSGSSQEEAQDTKAAEPSSADPARWYRVDPATTVLEIGPAWTPVVAQASTLDG